LRENVLRIGVQPSFLAALRVLRGGNPGSPTRDCPPHSFNGGDQRRSRFLADVAFGALSGLIVQLAVETAFRTMCTTGMNAERVALSALFVGVAAPAFAALGAATARLGAGPAAEVLLAALTAVLAPRLFVRMSVLPVYVLALVLLFKAAYRAGGRSTAGAAAFGAVMYGRAAAVVCAFY
jgi:hypothetical protein